jgi:hypothetical protein
MKKTGRKKGQGERGGGEDKALTECNTGTTPHLPLDLILQDEA